MGATRDLAEFSAALTYDSIPPNAVVIVKHLLLDTLGTTLAATTLGAGCRELFDVVVDLGGKPESTILGFGHKTTAVQAAMVNGALAHALNYDAVGPLVGHIGVVCLPGLLALAESIGGVSGRDFVTAATVAAEVTARITAAVGMTGRHASERFLAGQYLGYFGVAAGAARLLNMSADEVHGALGLALMQASGSMQIVFDGDPPAKAIYGAFPNHGGVLAALLARRGLGAPCDALEGVAGVYALVYNGDYDRRAFEGIGRDYLLLKTQFKPWPTSAIPHPFIEGALHLVRDGLKAADIESVEIVGAPRIRIWCEPLHDRRKPQNAAAAANSVPFVVAKVLANGKLELADFSAEGIHDDRATAVADRTGYILDPNVRGGIVRVRTKQGATLEKHIEVPLGDLSRPLSEDQLLKKFRNCCRFSINPMSPSQIEKLADDILGIQRIDNVAALAAATVGR